MENNPLVKTIRRAYEAFSERFPSLKKITELLPDNVYRSDQRAIELESQKEQANTARIATESELANKARELGKARDDLTIAKRQLAKYEGIEKRLETYEKVATDLVVALNDQRRTFQEGEARRAVEHSTDPKDFAIAINSNGEIIGASQRALSRLRSNEEQATGQSFYNYLNGQSEQLVTTIYNAAKSGSRIAKFKDLEITQPNGRARKIGDVDIRLHYCKVSPTTDQPYSNNSFAAASIITKEAFHKEARTRLRRMTESRRTRQKYSTQQPDTTITDPKTEGSPAIE